MKISELKDAPEWLVLANTENADVSRNVFGTLIWNSGNWLSGEFRGGYFLGGYFLGGEFRGGEFRGGYFRGGEFRGGEFLGGEFRGGEFRGGYFLGGEFRGGYFLGGEFRGGVMLPTCKWAYGIDPKGNLMIGCKTKSMAEWEDWFNGSEEYSTKRGTPEFERIRCIFETSKVFVKFLHNYLPASQPASQETTQAGKED